MPFRTRFDSQYSVLCFLEARINYISVFQIKLCCGLEIEGRSKKGPCALQIDCKNCGTKGLQLGFFHQGKQKQKLEVCSFSVQGKEKKLKERKATL